MKIGNSQVMELYSAESAMCKAWYENDRAHRCFDLRWWARNKNVSSNNLPHQNETKKTPLFALTYRAHHEPCPYLEGCRNASHTRIPRANKSKYPRKCLRKRQSVEYPIVTALCCFLWS